MGTKGGPKGDPVRGQVLKVDFSMILGPPWGSLFEASGARGGVGTRLGGARFWTSFVTGPRHLFDARWSRNVDQKEARGVIFRCSSSVLRKP